MKSIVIVGTGLAGIRMAEEIRALGFSGHLCLIGAEKHFPPYDRPPLSKEVLAKARQPEEMRIQVTESLDAEIRTGVEVSSLDLGGGGLTLSDGSEIGFDGLGIATGSRARTLACDGAGLPGVHTLRTVDDSLGLGAEMRAAARLVVVGAGFIGCEVASVARELGMEVTLVDTAAGPLSRAVGDEVAGHFAKFHRSHGVDLRMGVGVSAFLGDRRVAGVALSDGTALGCDVVLVAVGAVPNTAWLAGSGLDIDDGVLSAADLSAVGARRPVVVAGDVARWRHDGYGRDLRVEHWTNAAEQAAHAAGTLLTLDGVTQPYLGLPYFWSDQHGLRIQFMGIRGERSVVVSGQPGEMTGWTAEYRSESDELVGALCVNDAKAALRYRAAFARSLSAH